MSFFDSDFRDWDFHFGLSKAVAPLDILLPFA